MKYTLEEIYLLVGREDKTAGLKLIPGTDAYKKYGSFITVEFIYNQYERPDMDKMIQNRPFSNSGMVKARYLGDELSADQVLSLKKEGIHSDDIWEISYFVSPTGNTYHSEQQRTIKTFELPLRMKPKGGDLDWMYGFNRKMVLKSIGLSPKERAFYLAAKYFYEPNELTMKEKTEMFSEDGQLKDPVEWEYLQIKLVREDISAKETEKLGAMFNLKNRADFLLLDKYLQEVGSSMQKLAATNIDQAVKLFSKTNSFKERRLNSIGKIPVYLDVDGYLHIYTRHVEEMKVNDRFEHKDNFQWKEGDVFTVMQKVVQKIDKEIQDFFERTPNTRYSRYGSQSIYFEGDYYTIHIEPTGRIATFYKNKK
jgi:hypothetical protein